MSKCIIVSSTMSWVLYISLFYLKLVWFEQRVGSTVLDKDADRAILEKHPIKRV
jgi:hypothetical protein